MLANALGHVPHVDVLDERVCRGQTDLLLAVRQGFFQEGELKGEWTPTG